MLLTVLVVDDDPEVAALLAFQLKRMDCVVHQVHSGIKAEALASQVNLDIIFLDLMMPIQDGFITCKNLRQNGYTGIITMVSALAMEGNFDRAKASGANDYLQKPVSRDALADYFASVVK